MFHQKNTSKDLQDWSAIGVVKSVTDIDIYGY
jgi:hypothetical protein